MLFLVGITILTRDHKKIKIEKNIINESRYLQTQKDILNKSKNLNDISLFNKIRIDYDYKTFNDLLKIIQGRMYIEDIQDNDYNFKEILELFYKLDFKCLCYRKKFFKTILEMLYELFQKNLIENIQENEIYQDLLKKELIEIYNTYDDAYFLCNLKFYLTFLFENIKEFDFTFNLYLNYLSPHNKTFIQNISKCINQIEVLKLDIENKSDIMMIISNNNILYNLKNLILKLHIFTDLSFLSRLENLNYLEIRIYCVIEEDLIIPEIESLESLNIVCRSEKIKNINFGKFQNIKILSFVTNKISNIVSIKFDECFPNLEILYIADIYFNLDIDEKYLKTLFESIKNLKVIHLFVGRREFRYNLKKLEESMNIYVYFDLYEVPKSIFVRSEDKSFISIGGRFIPINEINNYLVNFGTSYFSSLYLKKNVPDDEILEKICVLGCIEILSLSDLVINKNMVANFRKLKYLKYLSIRNVEFEKECFFDMIDGLKYDIKILDLKSCKIPINELKVIGKLKCLWKLKILIDNAVEERLILRNLFNNLINNFKRLKVFILISDDFKKSDPIFIGLKVKGVKIYIENKTET